MLDLMEGDEENKKEYIDRIRKSTNRLHQLVDILLKLAVLDSGTVKMKKEIVNVKDLLTKHHHVLQPANNCQYVETAFGLSLLLH